MAKGNALLGTLRGSAGDVTFRVSNGRQVMSRKATSVKNPRSSKQTYQRMFFATIGKARSAMKKIVDHSFENVTKGMNSLSYFQSRNVELMRGNVKLVPELGIYTAVASYITPKWPYMVANTYRMSEGSLPILPQLPALLNGFGEDTFEDLYVARKCAPFFGVRELEYYSANVAYSILLSILNGAGTQAGDYFTYCFISRNWEEPTTGETPVPEKFHFIRLMVSDVTIESFDGKNSEVVRSLFLSNIDGKQYYAPQYFKLKLKEDAVFDAIVAAAKAFAFATISQKDDNVGILPVIYVNNLTFTSFNGEASPLYYKNAVPVGRILSEEEGIVAGTWIHSRPAADDSLLVSTQDMILTDPAGDVYDFNLGIRDAYDAWRNTGSSIGDNTYILEGGTK